MANDNADNMEWEQRCESHHLEGRYIVFASQQHECQNNAQKLYMISIKTGIVCRIKE